jgi:hypothetical protein
MKRFSLFMFAALLAITASSCSGKGEMILGSFAVQDSVRFTTLYMPTSASMATSVGDSVFIYGTLVPNWTPETWDKPLFVGLLASDGHIVGQFDRFVYAMGETLDFRPFYLHDGRLLPMFGSWSVNGTTVTARKYDTNGYTQMFRVTRDANQRVIVDPIADDVGQKIVRRTIRLTGVSTSNSSLPQEPVASTAAVAFASSYGNLITLPAVWRNNAWEFDVDVMRSTTFWVRPMKASSEMYVPGCYGINGDGSLTEFKNVVQQAPNWYYFTIEVDQNGNFYNKSASDQRGGIIGIR